MKRFLVVLALAAALAGPAPGADFVNVEGLGDVVGRANGKALDLVHHAVHHGDEDHRDAAAHRAALDAAANFVAIHLRHDDVKQHQVRRAAAGCQFHGPAAIGGHHDAVFVLEGGGQAVEVLGDVVHQQQGGFVLAQQGFGTQPDRTAAAVAA